MTRRIGQQEGWAVITAVWVMGLMMMFGLATFAVVDTQTRESQRERNRESSFNLTEAALQQQGYVLSFNWPGNASLAYADCSLSAGATPLGRCPQPPNLTTLTGTGSFTQADYRAGVQWTTAIRDNVDSSDAYSSAVSASTVKWDANGDDKVWVRASATVRGKVRTLVALLKRERLTEPFPRNGVTAGSFETSNNGNKTIVQATGSQVVVRCTTTTPDCTDYASNKPQIVPSTIVRNPATPPAMTDSQIERFKIAAQTSNPSTYYTSCPASFTGRVVFIDVPATNQCDDINGAVHNSAANPGIVIMPRGTLSMKGSYYGLLYLANKQLASTVVLELQDNSEVFGGVAIDGPGRLKFGQASGNRPTITYVSNAFAKLTTFGTAGLVQNTWRELPAGQ
jgi:Tfp pilus assembly protein PilX